MTTRTEAPKPDVRNLLRRRRKEVDLGDLQLVRTRPLVEDRHFPLLVEPAADEVDVASWGRDHRDFLNEKLRRHGALLFRGFGLRSVADFESFAAAVCPGLFGDYGDLPPEEQGEKVYHSTPYPEDKSILFHNEASHTERWPMKQWFFCQVAARQGGETPIVDCREIYRALRPELRRDFEDKGLTYLRNFTPGLDVSWQDFFRTEDRQEVEGRCAAAGVTCEWRSDGGLRIRQRAPAVAVHPHSGEKVFFNQIQLHHPSCLDPEVRASMRDLFGDDDLPRDVRFGDGTPIPDDAVREMLDLYYALSVAAPWQQGDVVLVDNMLIAHARNPFRGPRKIVVAMGEMYEAKDLAASTA